MVKKKKEEILYKEEKKTRKKRKKPLENEESPSSSLEKNTRWKRIKIYHSRFKIYHDLYLLKLKEGLWLLYIKQLLKQLVNLI